MARSASSRRVAALALFVAGAAIMASAIYIPAKAALAQVLLQRAWVRAQQGEKNVRPWPWADVTPIAEIEIPSLSERIIVLEGASGSAMAFAPGHMHNSAAIGKGGTAIIAAHRDTHFRDLGLLKTGDLIGTATADGRRAIYRVVATRIVRADASGLDPSDKGSTGSRLALVTCYPFIGLLHSKWRYVVLADRI